MRPSVHEVQREFIRLWSEMARFWGISRGTARVYAWLLAHPNGDDTDSIMAGLKMGRGTVSMACKELREWGLVRSRTPGGTRRIVHRVESDLSRVVRNIIAHRKRRELDPVLENTRDWLQRLDGDRSPETAIFRERLRAIQVCVGLVSAHCESFLEGGRLQDIHLEDLVRTAVERPRAAGMDPE